MRFMMDKPPLQSIALAGFPQAERSQIDLAAENRMQRSLAFVIRI